MKHCAKYVQSTISVADAVQTNQMAANGIDPQDADLVLSTLRHQRDLFSGPLGIPDVTTRVGSVIHAFETMARQRQSLGGNRDSYRADKPYDTMATGDVGTARYRSHRSNVKRIGDANRHKIILPSPKISPTSSAETGHFYPGQQFPHQAPISQTPSTHLQLSSSSTRQYHHDQHHHHLPPSSFSYTDPHGVLPGVRRHTSASSNGGGGGAPGEENIHINNNNFEQNLPHSVDDHNNHSQTLPRTVFPASLSVSGTNTIVAGTAIAHPTELPHYQLNNENESSNFDSLNLDDDYRKSSFGKQSKLHHHQQQQQQQQHQLFQRRNPPSNINTLLLARAQPSSGSSGNRSTARGLWSLFSGANNSSEPSNHPNATAGYSSSRNNPNVFFNASEHSRVEPLSVATPMTGSIAPLQMSTAPASNATGTMRYYNHDNNVNSANRHTTSPDLDSRQDTVGHKILDERATDGVTNRRNEADTSIANEGDNEATDNHVSGDKFLRGTTVSQSFIKNVRIIGKKSSSYDVTGPSQGATNANATHRKDSKKRSTGRSATVTADGTGTSGSSNGFKHRGSLMMAAAAKHFTKRNRAPQPTVVPDTDELTGTLRTPKPPEAATNNTDDNTANEHAPTNGGPPPVKARAPIATGTANRRLLFQPRTIDRAEI
uniref:Uncharacterized protein n=1 Tax=Anopheles culicifacies TaxID=139723 RepID=A0A182MWJ5_9DIPT